MVVPLRPDALEQVWFDMKARKRGENMLEYNLLNCPFELREQNEVVVQVPNMIMVEQFNSLRNDLLMELKQRLNNRSIRLSVEISAADEGQKMLYTSQDKFNHLAEKYPVLHELRQRLGLDMNF